MKHFKHLLYLLIFMSMLLLSACHHEEKKTDKQHHTITVKLEPLTNTLYFSGYIQPVNILPVTTPVAGSVNNMHFKFGDRVKKDQLLYEVATSSNSSSAQSAITSFLKQKNQLMDSKNKMDNSKELHQAGLISDNELRQDIETYYSNNLAFLQARESLKTSLLPYRNLPDVTNLTLSDMDKIKQIMLAINQQKNIKIYSPADGVALTSNNQNNGNGQGSNSSGNATVGTTLKQNQLLVNIGQMKEIAVNVSVDELNIEQITAGQAATITNDALPSLMLKGKIKSISQEGNTSGALPTFAVKVIVPHLTKEQKEQLRFGMSAQVAIQVKHPPALMVPISAVQRKGAQTVVTLASGKTVPVETGKTTKNQVVVLSGLKSGDKILVPN